LILFTCASPLMSGAPIGSTAEDGTRENELRDPRNDPPVRAAPRNGTRKRSGPTPPHCRKIDVEPARDDVFAIDPYAVSATNDIHSAIWYGRASVRAQHSSSFRPSMDGHRGHSGTKSADRILEIAERGCEFTQVHDRQPVVPASGEHGYASRASATA